MSNFVRTKVYDEQIQEQFDEYVEHAAKELGEFRDYHIDCYTEDKKEYLSDKDIVELVLRAHANKLREDLLKLLDDQIVHVAENAESLREFVNVEEIGNEARCRELAAMYLSETRSLLANWPYEIPSSNYVVQQSDKILELEAEVAQLVMLNRNNEDKIEDLQHQISNLEEYG